MMQDEIIRIKPETEGFTGEVESLEKNPRPLLYTAQQNKLALQAVPTAIEKIPIKIKVKKDGELTHEPHNIPALVFHFGQEFKGIIPATETGFLRLDNDISEEDAALIYLQLPNSEKKTILRKMESVVGKQVAFHVKKIDDTVALLSRRDALAAMAERTWQELKVGDIRNVTIHRIYKRYIYCNTGGVAGIIPAEEVAHGYVDIASVVEEGKTYQAKVIKIPEDRSFITLSLKALQKDPWEYVPNKYSPRNSYLATITGILDSGAGFFITFEPGVTGVVKHPAYYNPKVGDQVLVFIQSVNIEKRYIFGRIKRLVNQA